jgi:hypothetical protein
MPAHAGSPLVVGVTLKFWRPASRGNRESPPGDGGLLIPMGVHTWGDSTISDKDAVTAFDLLRSRFGFWRVSAWIPAFAASSGLHAQMV